MNRDDALAFDVPALLAELRAQRLLCATAESCTGGLVAAALTAVAGSSDVFDRGFVTYSNAAKRELLGVDDALLVAHGAVSEPVAKAMAEGALARSAAQLAVAVTGIAGPGGGTAEKPVGMVCFGFAMQGSATTTTTRHFPGDRPAVRASATAMALDGLWWMVQGRR
jgi:nicotinamide-nucleotide amidase